MPKSVGWRFGRPSVLYLDLLCRRWRSHFETSPGSADIVPLQLIVARSRSPTVQLPTSRGKVHISDDRDQDDPPACRGALWHGVLVRDASQRVLGTHDSNVLSAGRRSKSFPSDRESCASLRWGGRRSVQQGATDLVLFMVPSLFLGVKRAGERKKLWVGLDVGADAISCCIVDEAGGILLEQALPTRAADLNTLLKPLKRRVQLVALEAGSSGTHLARLMRRLGYPITLFDTRQASKFLAIAEQDGQERRPRLGGIARVGQTVVSQVRLKAPRLSSYGPLWSCGSGSFVSALRRKERCGRCFGSMEVA